MFLASSRLISEGEVTAKDVSRAVNRGDYHCIPARDGRDIGDAGNDECAHGAAGRFVPLTALVDGPHEWHSAQRPAQSLPTVVGAFRFCCERVEPLARPGLNSSVRPAEQLYRAKTSARRPRNPCICTNGSLAQRRGDESFSKVPPQRPSFAPSSRLLPLGDRYGVADGRVVLVQPSESRASPGPQDAGESDRAFQT